jgi:hypothetical protein
VYDAIAPSESAETVASKKMDNGTVPDAGDRVNDAVGGAFDSRQPPAKSNARPMIDRRTVFLILVLESVEAPFGASHLLLRPLSYIDTLGSSCQRSVETL